MDWSPPTRFNKGFAVGMALLGTALVGSMAYYWIAQPPIGTIIAAIGLGLVANAWRATVQFLRMPTLGGGQGNGRD